MNAVLQVGDPLQAATAAMPIARRGGLTSAATPRGSLEVEFPAPKRRKVGRIYTVAC
jgi:hypothetical protein